MYLSDKRHAHLHTVLFNRVWALFSGCPYMGRRYQSRRTICSWTLCIICLARGLRHYMYLLRKAHINHGPYMYAGTFEIPAYSVATSVLQNEPWSMTPNLLYRLEPARGSHHMPEARSKVGYYLAPQGPGGRAPVLLRTATSDLCNNHG